MTIMMIKMMMLAQVLHNFPAHFLNCQQTSTRGHNSMNVHYWNLLYN